MKINELCIYAPKSNVKAGEAVQNGEFMFFTSSSDESKRYSNYQIDSEAIIMGTGGNATLHYYNGKFATSTDCVVLIVNNNIIRCKYLYYYLLAHIDILEQGFKGAGLKHTNKNYIGNIEINNIPSIEIQDTVIGIIDNMLSLIDIKKKEMGLFDELVKARFVELFGDGRDGKTPVKMLGHICRFQQGTQIPVEEQFEEQKTGYKRFLRIIDYTQAPQPPRYVNVNGKEVDEKSVVIVRYGATAGFVGRGYQGILANNLFEIMPDETILSKEFLFLALKYGTFEKEVHDKAFGAAMPALSFSMMNDIPVVVPMAEEQKKFVSFVEQTDKSKSVCEEKIKKYTELYDKLMNDYFGG